MLICTNRGCVGTKRKLMGMGGLLGFAFASLTISLRSDLCCDNSFFFRRYKFNLVHTFDFSFSLFSSLNNN